MGRQAPLRSGATAKHADQITLSSTSQGMKTERIIKELEDAARQLGLTPRWEKGNFRGGRCIVNGQPTLVLNKRHAPEVQLAVLADALRDLPVDTIFLKPAVREAMQDAWARHAEVMAEVADDD